MTRLFQRQKAARLAIAAVCVVNGCGPKAAPQVTAIPVPPPYEQKFAAILRLEDERQLRSVSGDLLQLMQDTDPRLRRRAALAAGRVKLPDGIPVLTTLLSSDPDPEVEQMAAFALGLIGDDDGERCARQGAGGSESSHSRSSRRSAWADWPEGVGAGDWRHDGRPLQRGCAERGARRRDRLSRCRRRSRRFDSGCMRWFGSAPTTRWPRP